MFDAFVKQLGLDLAKSSVGLVELLLNDVQSNVQGSNTLIIIVGGCSSTLDETTVGLSELVESTLRELQLSLYTPTLKGQIRDLGRMGTTGLNLSALSKLKTLREVGHVVQILCASASKFYVFSATLSR